MKERVYLETSFISYLAAPPRNSRDIVTAAHHQVTVEWWDLRRHIFDVFVSEIVLDEAERGNPDVSALRGSLLSSISCLPVLPEARELARAILASGLLPRRAAIDALHLSVATVHELDYLLTWNCKHLANQHVLPRLAVLVERLGLALPIVCTPEELMEEADAN